MNKNILFLLVCLCFLMSFANLQAEEVQASLISEVQTIEPGKSFWVGCRLEMKEHWHTYWTNPGDSGLATKIEWELPEGFQPSEIYWPYPEWISAFGAVTFGYEGEIILLSKINVPEDAKIGESISLKGNVSWLACEKTCVPGKASVSINLVVGEKEELNESHKESFAKARAALPEAEKEGTFQAEAKKNSVSLLISFPEEMNGTSKVTFFPKEAGVFDYAIEQKLEKVDQGYLLHLTVSEYWEEPVTKLTGVLVWENDESHSVWEVDVAVETAKETSETKTERKEDEKGAVAENSSTVTSFAIALIFSFVGGLILNLMPCVLPVLSLKILGFVKEAGGDQSKIWKNGVFFTMGVMFSFWSLAGLLIFLKSGGEQLGWGFQLQSPQFVILLGTLFFLIGLNLFGVFEVGTSLMSAGMSTSKQSGLFSSFSSGVLATVAATPCTAPFMGSAIGFTLSEPAYISLLIFSAIGLGMATPYLLVSCFPGLLSVVPKPGPWMETFKQFMGFPMMATVIWLIWVFGQQQGINGTAFMLGILLLVGIGGWIYGRWGNFTKGKTTRAVAKMTFLLILILSLVLPSLVLYGPDEASVNSSPWLDFSTEKLEELREEGKPVFIDFTAAWCLTCQFNKKFILHTQEVSDKFAELGVIKMQADWTNHDEEITKALAKFGRNSVPVYVFYPKGINSTPILLPEVLTVSLVLERLDQAP